MKLFLSSLLVVAAGVSAAAPKWHQLTLDYSHEQYMKDFNKEYSASELPMRREIFEKELRSVMAHNDKKLSWQRGINKFSDWTATELKSLRGDKGSQFREHARKTGAIKPERMYVTDSRSLPASKDWRNTVPAVLTGVKDQGQCGSCWAHSTAEAVETSWALATGELFVLSQQQIASCTHNPLDCGGTGGCEGGIYELGIESIAYQGGIGQEWSTPYQSYMGKDFSCSSLNIWKNLTKVKMSGYTAIEKNSLEAALHAIAFTSPLAMSADASSWSSYESGIASPCTYINNATSTDHAIAVTGFGTDPATGIQFVWVRNSWGVEWGEDGYMKMAVYPTDGPRCGWNTSPGQGSGCKGDNNPVFLCGTCGWLGELIFANAQNIQP